MSESPVSSAGRPSIDPLNKRSMFVGMNITPIEHAKFLAAVDASGLSMSDFFRKKFKKDLK